MKQVLYCRSCGQPQILVHDEVNQCEKCGSRYFNNNPRAVDPARIVISENDKRFLRGLRIVWSPDSEEAPKECG